MKPSHLNKYTRGRELQFFILNMTLSQLDLQGLMFEDNACYRHILGWVFFPPFWNVTGPKMGYGAETYARSAMKAYNALNQWQNTAYMAQTTFLFHSLMIRDTRVVQCYSVVHYLSTLNFHQITDIWGNVFRFFVLFFFCLFFFHKSWKLIVF
jgi:hypothetical protein